MVKSHLKLAFRNIKKYPAFSLINLGGLSIGIAASFILLIYAQREISCDRHFRDPERIARIGTDFYNMGGFAQSQPLLRDFLQATCKDIAFATSLARSKEAVPVRLDPQDRAFSDVYPYYTDKDFFHVFSYEAAEGVIPARQLAPGEVILTQAAAQRFFGSGQDGLIGRTLLIGKDQTPCKVVAILKDHFEKSHLTPSVILPLPASAATGNPEQWATASLYNYVKLAPQGSLTGLGHWLDRLQERVVFPSSHTTQSFAQWKSDPTSVKFILQPLTNIYFHTYLKFELSPGGNLTQVRLLEAISIFLLLLAIINYVNLVTARTSVRSKEIRLKAILGASRRDLFIQIMVESLLFSFMAMLMAGGLIKVILLIYLQVTGTPLTGPIPMLLSHYGWLFLFSMVTGLIAGIYPAFYLTTMRQWQTMSPANRIPGNGTTPFRNILVLVQFSVAATLLFITFIIFSQVDLMKHKDKGFRAQEVILVSNAGVLGNQADAFKNWVEQQSQVVSASYCNRVPGDNTEWMITYRTAGMEKDLSLPTFPVDEKYLATLGMHLNAGRNFSRNLLSDTNALILNESAVAALGLFNPIGATINGSERVIGVVKDFNYASMREKIGPAILRFSPTGKVLAIKIQGGHTDAFLNLLARAGKTFQARSLVQEPLTISFLDENFSRMAEKERQLGRAISFFTILAIILATLGLTGLTIFTIERRTKEIGIRKVLGAHAGNILRLVWGDFLRVATLASLIALPAGWWLVNGWLANYAYHVSFGMGASFGLGMFFLTELILLSIAFGVFGTLTLRSGLRSPVKALQS